jgi:threonine/homoserine/homoserine lactone efflux protein
MCLAAYLALAGLGLSVAAAANLRIALLTLGGVVLLWLARRRFMRLSPSSCGEKANRQRGRGTDL